MKSGSRLHAGVRCRPNARSTDGGRSVVIEQVRPSVRFAFGRAGRNGPGQLPCNACVPPSRLPSAPT